MKVEEIKPRASEGDTIELEGRVSHAQKPNEGQYGWSQFIGVKDSTGEQNCWIKLGGEEDKVTKGTAVKIKGKLGEEYEDRKSKKMVRSINGCDFEVIGKTQAPAQSSSSGDGNGTKDNYWEKKFKYEVEKDPIVQLVIVRQCAIKAVTELAKVTPSKNFLIKVHTEKDFFEFAIKIEKHIFRNLVLKESVLTFGGKITGVKKNGTPKVETKEEKIEKAEEVVGETRFKPASTEQKKYIYGYRNNDDKWYKGIIESRYMEKPEIREIGAPEKLSLEDATDWLLWWWGLDKKSGERKKRERENPRDTEGNLISELEERETLVKGNKTSIVKDDLIYDINAWRRENFLIDDKKFKEELGYNPNLEKLSEEDLLKIKKLIKNYHPKSWNGDK